MANDANEVSAIRRWSSWIREVKGLGGVSPDLSWVKKEDRPWWAAEFLLHVYSQEGKRHEQVKLVKESTRSGFRTNLWDHAIWDSTLVESLIGSCRRTHEEVTREIRARAQVEKYDWNLEAMKALWDRLRPDQVPWGASPSKEEVDGALMFLLAAFMLDMGIRVGMVTHQNIGSESDWCPDPPLLSEAETGGEQRDKEWVRSHTWKNEKLRFTCLGEGGCDTTCFVEGGKPMAVFLKENDNSRVVDFQVWFDTSKTVQRGMKAPMVPQWTPFGRRSAIESDVLDVFLNFIRWNRYEGEETEVLKRCRPIVSEKTGRVCPGKLVRASDLIKVCKEIAEGEGVPGTHISAISFRKGNATLMSLMCAEDLKNKEEALALVKSRANKWSTKSKVPLRHYIATLSNRGPLARIDSWEEGTSWGTGIQGWRNRLPPGQDGRRSLSPTMGDPRLT